MRLPWGPDLPSMPRWYRLSMTGNYEVNVEFIDPGMAEQMERIFRGISAKVKPRPRRNSPCPSLKPAPAAAIQPPGHSCPISVDCRAAFHRERLA